MLTRRTLLTHAALFAMLPVALHAQGADPTGFVVQLGNTLVAIVNGPGGYDDKKRR